MKKRVIIASAFVLSCIIIAVILVFRIKEVSFLSPIDAQPTIIPEKPLEKYSFERLKNRNFSGSPISIERELKNDPDFTSRLFFYESDGKKVSGLINLPAKSGKFPVIVMFRGYVDVEKYTTGEGTRRSGEVFAKNGFITLSPDFLGYGDSASPSASSIEERFETYTAASNLLSSIPNLNRALDTINNGEIQADPEKIGIWGHSNGGHIAISVLEITGKGYPAVLWAPVTKPFPYSILYFTDEFEDHGKTLRKVVADFEKDYDAERYSPTNYFDWITAHIELHQGTADEAVPLRWSDDFVKQLKKLDKNITYYTYPGDDHNFAQGSWGKVVERNISFYRNRL